MKYRWGLDKENSTIAAAMQLINRRMLATLIMN